MKSLNRSVVPAPPGYWAFMESAEAGQSTFLAKPVVAFELSETASLLQGTPITIHLGAAKPVKPFVVLHEAEMSAALLADVSGLHTRASVTRLQARCARARKASAGG